MHEGPLLTAFHAGMMLLFTIVCERHEPCLCRVMAELALGRPPCFDVQPLSASRAAVGLQCSDSKRAAEVKSKL